MIVEQREIGPIGTASRAVVGVMAIPVIGVGVLADATDLVAAGTVFAAVVAALAAAAIAGTLRLRRQPAPA